MKCTVAFKVYCITALLACTALLAQQEPQYTQYMYNTLTVNPGYTGSPGYLEGTLQHRSQWVGIDGAPTTQAFTLHAPWSIDYNHIGIGLSVVNDNLGPSNEVYADANFSYALQMGQNSRLAFGLKAGLRSLNIDWSKGRYYQPGDPLLNNNINNRMNPNIGAGIYYYTNRWYAGLSVPNFIRNDYYNDVQESMMADRLHYYVMGGYVFDVSENVKFKPAVLGKIVNGAPIVVDASANFLLQETVTLGASYRWDDSISALAGLQITRNIFAGYSYDYSVTDLNKYNNGSHEIIVRFTLQPKTARIHSPRFF